MGVNAKVHLSGGNECPQCGTFVDVNGNAIEREPKKEGSKRRDWTLADSIFYTILFIGVISIIVGLIAGLK